MYRSAKFACPTGAAEGRCGISRKLKSPWLLKPSRQQYVGCMSRKILRMSSCLLAVIASTALLCLSARAGAMRPTPLSPPNCLPVKSDIEAANLLQNVHDREGSRVRMCVNTPEMYVSTPEPTCACLCGKFLSGSHPQMERIDHARLLHCFASLLLCGFASCVEQTTCISGTDEEMSM